jgi:hypothetical protein
MIVIVVQSVFRIEMQIFFYLKKIIFNINTSTLKYIKII